MFQRNKLPSSSAVRWNHPRPMAHWTLGRWRRYMSSVCQEPLNLQYSVTSQKTRILDLKTMKIQNLTVDKSVSALYIYCCFTVDRQPGCSDPCCPLRIVAIGLWFTEGCVQSWELCWYNLTWNWSGWLLLMLKLLYVFQCQVMYKCAPISTFQPSNAVTTAQWFCNLQTKHNCVALYTMHMYSKGIIPYW